MAHTYTQAQTQTDVSHLAQSTVEEIELLTLFSLSSTLKGLKIHHAADAGRIRAGERLHAKGLTTQADGGYLTPLGVEAAEHAQALIRLLHSA